MSTSLQVENGFLEAFRNPEISGIKTIYRFPVRELKKIAWYSHWRRHGIGDEISLLSLNPPGNFQIKSENGIVIFDGKYPFDEHVVNTVFDTIRENPVVLLHGPPGTGKTMLASLLCRYLAPFSYIYVMESSLIPGKWGINSLEPLQKDYHCIVLDDFLLLLTPRMLEEYKHFQIIFDVQNHFREFLDFARVHNIIVFITTNVRPSAIESAIATRVAPVEVPPPSSSVKEKLKELGYKIVDEKGRTFRELLWKVDRGIVEIPPTMPPGGFNLWYAWNFMRVEVFKPVCRKCGIDLTREALIKIASVLAAVLERPAVFLKQLHAAEQLYFYKKPIVVMDEVADKFELRRLALKHNATILLPIPRDKHTDYPTIEVDPLLEVVCPKIDDGVRLSNCFKKWVEEANEGGL